MSTLTPPLNNSQPQFHYTRRLPSASHRKAGTSVKLKANISAYLTPLSKHTIELNSHIESSKALLETTLPQISSKRSVQKRSGLLQMWLDEALDPQEKPTSQQAQPNSEQLKSNAQVPQLRVQVDKTGPLRTVQKFHLDKKFLKSQNMSQEAIDKIYHSLYVYSYGINNVFSQVMAMTKANEHADRKIINHFWRAFIQLLQGCTSFRTTFQIIQEDHLKYIAQLKGTFIQREQEWRNGQVQIQQQNIKLLRKVNQQSALISKITTDYNISEATLYLTDQAFNQQVNTRLKFQQKVNQMFNSYDQIRVKYQTLLEDLHIKGDQALQSKQERIRMESRIEQLEIDLKQQSKQNIRAQSVIVERQEELMIKRQQIFQLQGVNKVLVDGKDQEAEEVRRIINKMEQFRLLSQQYKAQVNSKTVLAVQLQKRIEQNQKQLLSSRTTEQNLYNQLAQNSKQIAELKSNQTVLELTISEQNLQNYKLKQTTQSLQQSNQESSQTITQLEHRLSVAQGDIAIKSNFIEKNINLITQLQGVNGRAQSMLKSMTIEKRRLQGQMHQSMKVCESFKEQMLGMKMLLQNKMIQLSEAEIKLQNQREVFKSKIASLKEEVEVRDQKVLEFHNQMQEGQHIVSQKVKQARNSYEVSKDLRNQILNLEASLSQEKIRLQSLLTEKISSNSTYNNLEGKLQATQEQSMLYLQQLKMKETLLASADNLTEAEALQLRVLLQSYREERERSPSYVHPMLLEDCLEQIDRLTMKKAQLLDQSNNLVKQKKGLQLNIEELRRQGQEKDLKYSELLQLWKLNEQGLKKAGQKMKQLEKIIEINKKTSAQQLQVKCGQIVRLQRQLKNLKNQIQTVEGLANSSTSAIHDQTSRIIQLQKEHQSLSAQVDQLMAEAVISQQTIIRLQEQTKSQRDVKTQQQQRKRQESPKSPKKKIVEEMTIPDRPKPKQVDQQSQTEKKFSHSNKFQVATANQVACQTRTEEGEQKQIVKPREERGERVQRGARDHDARRVDASEYKRALKVTYMRR